MTHFTALSAAALTLALALPAFAQQDGEAALVDTSPVADTIATFIATLEQAYTSGDMDGVFAVMPPAMLTHIAAKFGKEDAELRALRIDATKAVMAQVKLEDFGMDLAAAESGRTPAGHAYAFVPTTSTMAIEGRGRFRSENITLALEDGGEWYLIRVDDPYRVALLREVYPDMADIEFPQGTMEQL